MRAFFLALLVALLAVCPLQAGAEDAAHGL